MSKLAIIKSATETGALTTLEIFQLRALIENSNPGKFEAQCIRYLNGSDYVFTLAIVSGGNEFKFLRIKHANEVRVFKSEKAVSEAVTKIGLSRKTTYFVDSFLYF